MTYCPREIQSIFLQTTKAFDHYEQFTNSEVDLVVREWSFVFRELSAFPDMISVISQLALGMLQGITPPVRGGYISLLAGYYGVTLIIPDRTTYTVAPPTITTIVNVAAVRGVHVLRQP